MKKLKNRQIIAINDFKSDYFEEAVFVLKDNIVAKDDDIFHEAVKLASDCAVKFEKRKDGFPFIIAVLLFSALSITGIIALLQCLT